MKGWLLGMIGLVAAGAALEMFVERGVVLAGLAVLVDWLLHPVRAPIGIFLLLVIVGAALPTFLRWRRNRPRHDHYTRDQIGGVIWEWRWEAGRAYPDSPNPICPECLRAMRVLSESSPADGEMPASDVARCQCGFTKIIGRGGNYIDELFRVEVDRRVRIGYWQDALERWGRCGLPIPPPSEAQGS